MKKTAMLVLLSCFLLIPVCALAQPMEHKTDRPGSDYADFDLARPDAKLCQERCQNDPNCKAWTYARPNCPPTNPTSKGYCWLKNGPTHTVANECCTSGVKHVAAAVPLTYIVAIDYSCWDHNVYAWYSNGMVSIGDYKDLAHKQEPRPFRLPPGKKATDIMAAYSRCFEGTMYYSASATLWTYYKDGTLSLGKFDNLGGSAKPANIGIPSGKTLRDVVAIALSSDGELVWFKDGTGILNNKQFHYHVPAGKKFTDILQISIGSGKDATYTWYKDGTVSIGSHEDLDKKQSPKKYHHPYER